MVATQLVWGPKIREADPGGLGACPQKTEPRFVVLVGARVGSDGDGDCGGGGEEEDEVEEVEDGDDDWEGEGLDEGGREAVEDAKDETKDRGEDAEIDLGVLGVLALNERAGETKHDGQPDKEHAAKYGVDKCCHDVSVKKNLWWWWGESKQAEEGPYIASVCLGLARSKRQTSPVRARAPALCFAQRQLGPIIPPRRRNNNHPPTQDKTNQNKTQHNRPLDGG
ncbi:hypothetical protein TRICI_000671 [Trichomonascus ciferrii]|uniref:Uncharacterized protein n=1 Tax=Trichomonascus ciferrii TaxID=44093 RepID=A0A642VBB9_9ASCO|nr:hypothetical protein TRICI_000671 [Trichomonascus ciferrii]